MVQDIDDVVEVVRTVMPRHPEIRKVRLFGSFARGEQGPGSDVDLPAVPEWHRTYAQDFSLREDLRGGAGKGRRRCYHASGLSRLLRRAAEKGRGVHLWTKSTSAVTSSSACDGVADGFIHQDGYSSKNLRRRGYPS